MTTGMLAKDLHRARVAVQVRQMLGGLAEEAGERARLPELAGARNRRR